MKNIYVLPNKNIYITSDEEIKDKDWFLATKDNLIYKLDSVKNPVNIFAADKKIILTTDKDLIQDNIQAIDDEFFRWFINNSGCEYVKVEDNIVANATINHGNPYRYDIIIPREGSHQDYTALLKQVGTIEEVKKKSTILELDGHKYSTKEFEGYLFRAKFIVTTRGDYRQIINTDIYTTNNNRDEVQNILINRIVGKLNGDSSVFPEETGIIYWTTKEQDESTSKFIDDIFKTW